MKNEENTNSIQVIAELVNYKYPKTKPTSGDFAIIIVSVKKVLEGTLYDENGKILPISRSCEPTITIVGKMPTFLPQEQYIIYAHLVKNKSYGYQYDIDYVRLNYQFNSIDEQKKFLSYFLTDNQINNLFAVSANPIQLLEDKNIGALTKVKGIGPIVARRICDRYEDSKDKSRAYITLKDLGLTKKAIDKLISVYNSPDIAVEKINENPYILIKEVRGYGWNKADVIALKKGFARDCKFRALAYINYYLQEEGEQNGNSWVDVVNLLNATLTMCSPLTKEKLVEWFKEVTLNENEFVSRYNSYDNKMSLNLYGLISEYEKYLLVYDPKTHHVGSLRLRLLEKEIERHIIRLKTAQSKFTFDPQRVEAIIKEVEQEKNFTYTQEQRDAIYNILNNNISILTGSAGTGKTTTMIAVTRVLSYYKVSIAQCALSGRASSNLREMTSLNGSTIHRLLRYVPDTESFAYTERAPLPYGTVILDEVSMVGGELFLSLISAIATGAKFVMIGDPNQLEAIGLCNILQDCLNSHYVPIVSLKTIHRQAARSGIIVNANLACTGKNLVANDFIGTEIRGELRDFKIDCVSASDIVYYNILEEFNELYHNRGIPASDIQIIVPMRSKGNISCHSLNQVIQQIVNPDHGQESVTISFRDNEMTYNVIFREGDRIIVTTNNYSVMTPSGKETAIYNGNIGFIKSIESDYMLVNLIEQGEVIIQKSNWGDLQLAYAITCHKLQGSSAPYVIFGLNSTNYIMLSKELVYTAITRAKKYCIVVSQAHILNNAVHITKTKHKQTWLGIDLKADASAELERNSSDEFNKLLYN